MPFCHHDDNPVRMGFRVKFTVWSLLAMIIGFTFLTFYSAYYNKVTDCGCFGDAMKIEPWESFWKDIILLILIVILFIGRKHITPFFTKRTNRLIIFFTLVLSGFYVYYVMNHLPVIDFRAYEIGKNIEDGMNVPEGAPESVFEYAWKFNVNGEEKVIVTNGSYPNVEGDKYISVKTTEIQEGYEPPVHDFTVEQNGEDFAGSLLQEPKLMMVVAYDLRKTNNEMYPEVKRVAALAIKNGDKVNGVSASNSEQTSKLIQDNSLGFEFYFTDETTLKTIVRSNPGILVLEKGTIKQKVHYNDFDELEFN